MASIVDMFIVTKFIGLGDASTSLNNEYFLQYVCVCDLMTVPNISNGQFAASSGYVKCKGHSASGASLSDPHQGLCPLEPRWGLCSQMPLNRLARALVMTSTSCQGPALTKARAGFQWLRLWTRGKQSIYIESVLLWMRCSRMYTWQTIAVWRVVHPWEVLSQSRLLLRQTLQTALLS